MGTDPDQGGMKQKVNVFPAKRSSGTLGVSFLDSSACGLVFLMVVEVGDWTRVMAAVDSGV